MLEIASIILVNLALYARTIFFSVVIDDISRKKVVPNIKFGRHFFTERLYGAGTFKDDRLDHALSIFLHTIASILIYKAFGSTDISFLGSLIYSVHPVNNQTAVWMNGRRYIINLILVLLIWIFKPLGILLYAITPLFQINAISAPLLYIFTGYWYIPALCLFFPFFGNRYIIEKFKDRRSEKVSKSELARIYPLKAILILKTFGYYFWHIIFPLKVSFYPDFYQTFGITKTGNTKTYAITPDFWLGIVALGACGVAYFYLPDIRFYIFWFVIFIAPFCNLITITQLVADRYTSIAIVGLVMAMAHLISGNTYLIGIILGVYATKSWNVQNMYRTIDDFYLYHIYNSPKSILPIIYYAKACIGGGMFYHAYVALRRGIIYNPKDMRLWLMLAKTLKLIGHKGPAAIALNSAAEQLSDNIWETQEVLINDIKKVREGLK